jgi:lysyl endopeptidase
MKKRLLTILGLSASLLSFGQISEGGLPTTFSKVIQGETPEYNKEYQVVALGEPNLTAVYSEDTQSSEKGETYRVSVITPLSLNVSNSGTWEILSNGDQIWRLGIQMPNAQALSLYFSENVSIPEGGKLHAYNSNHSQYIGGYTSETPGFQSMEIIEGDLITLEYYMPAGSSALPTIEINNIAYYYRGVEDRIAMFREGFSVENQIKAHQSCEVDVACSEINGWEAQRDAVVQYFFVVGGSGYVCSGSMINNTNNDCTPYFLTANHCGEPTTNANISQHTFYFNYQRPTCTPGNTATYNGAQSETMSGGMLRASSALGNQPAANGNEVDGSDFILIEMNTAVPAGYNSYFEGWDRSASGATSGVGIHHPAGDEKKISTYSSTLSSTTYNGGWSNAHWLVTWVATANGHGVTEGGSSGSPIFNQNGLVVGHLSGGSSFCNTPNSPDLYGKFDRAWDQEGNNANQQLKAWLDPGNTGSMSLSGTYAPCGPAAPIAQFIANATNVTPGTTVTFTDQSSGSPTAWAWSISPAAGWAYAGGTNASSQNPQVTFNTLGLHTVTLVASNALGSDSEIKTNYINVTNVVGPCDATSTQSCAAADEYISNVTLNTINNNSACTGYSDFTAQSTTLTQNGAYTVTVVPTVNGNAGSAYTDDEISVWIDWNNDADFNDAGEQVGYALVGAGWSNVYNFTVPANATVGNVTMRVRISYLPDDGPIDPCGTTQWGETEDYTINVEADGGGAVTAPVAQFTANLTTAPVGTTISFTDLSTNSPTSWAWVLSPASGWSYAGGTSASSQNPQVNFITAGTYTVTLTASNAGGSDSEVKTSYIIITDNGTDGVNENGLNSISIYPNPTNSSVFVNLNEVSTDITSIELKDVTGRIIAEQSNPNGTVEFNLTSESAGIYFVTINSNDGAVTKKVIRF